MKVLQIVQGISNEADGVAVFVRGLAAELRRQGHVCDVLTRDDCRVEMENGRGDAGSLSRVEREKGREYDVVHVNALWSPWLHRMAKEARKAGCKIVWSPHGMLTPWALKNKWWKKALGLALYQWWDLRKADLLHVTAQSEVEDVRRLGLKNEVVVAPLGVEIRDKRLEIRDKRVESRDKRVDGGARTLLFVSRVQRKKGLPMLLEAWAKIRDKREEIRDKREESREKSVEEGWVLKIAGPDQNGHTAELKEQAKRLGIEDSVQFLGPVYGEAKDELYASADLFVLPTHSENFGSVVVEALAAGCPVVCTKGAPWSELETEKCGWWCDTSAEGIEGALRDAMSLSDDDRRAMGENGRRLVEAKYTWEAVGKKMLAAYEEVLRG